MLYTTSLLFWLIVAVALAILAVVAGLLFWLITRQRPVSVRQIGSTRIELWSTGRRFPRRTDLLIVPVSPGLQMVAGSSLWARGVSADRAQRDAQQHAPMDPGEAIIVSGARYRFRNTALAVVMDSQKRYDAGWIRAAVRRSVELAGTGKVRSVMIPDWTDDLVRQPRKIDADLRRRTASFVAATLMDAVRDLDGQVHVVRFWVRDPALVDAYRAQMDQPVTTARTVAA